MKFFNRFLFIILLACSAYLPTLPAAHPREAFMPYSYEHIIDKHGNPSQTLLELLAILGIEHDGTLRDIVRVTQLHLLRPQNSERWHMLDVYQQHAATIMPLLKKLGCLDAVEPTQQQYDYVLLLGATVSRVRDRLRYVVSLCEQGLRFKTIIFLGSERPLDPAVEPADLLTQPTQNNYPYLDPTWKFNGIMPTTEYEMMRLVFEQTEFPAGFENVTFCFLNTPMQPTATGGTRRANTIDTIVHWISTNPIPGTCLATSNQPFVGYQDSAVRSALPKNFPLETVGSKASDTLNIAVGLDNLTRWIYQENLARV